MLGLWLQTGAICVSAIAAILLILWTRRVACRRATLDILMQEQTNGDLISERRRFIDLRDKGDRLVQWAGQPSSAECATIRTVLNRYELTAIGIFCGAVDEALYKSWCRTTLVRDWTACKAFVTELRSTARNPKYFCEFEKLAGRWALPAERADI